ncbi:bile acid:sodium symporter [Paenibacillus beijingensis]|uniref:Bile acid:sodium symporter n=2 Tax=Paenibacillus beijingensis TaxID=1126833 RepID=A0A0D5NQY0_9BACL|nr:bile acid:sodium symporter family protein [Paenibacillus beijingensis]AJY77427.1 bile acid:sodium symporter [Paenibacillus beijingensis]
MFLIIPGALFLGFIFSDQLLPFAGLAPWLFAYVTLVMAIGCGPEQLLVVLRRPWAILLSLLLAHVVSPLAAYGAGTLLLGSDSPYVAGLVLFTLIPLGVSTVLWVALSGGSVPLVLAMVVLDSLLSPIVVPAGIRLLFSQGVSVDTGSVISDLLLIVVLPTVAGVLLHIASRGRIQPAVKPYAVPLSKLCFIGVVSLNAAVIAPHAALLKADMIRIVPLVILLVGFCYAIGFIGTIPMRSRQLQTTVSYATGMRNISLGTVLAMGYFSPLAAVPVVLSILIQQPLATLHHYVLRKIYNDRSGAAERREGTIQS